MHVGQVPGVELIDDNPLRQLDGQPTYSKYSIHYTSVLLSYSYQSYATVNTYSTGRYTLATVLLKCFAVSNLCL